MITIRPATRDDVSTIVGFQLSLALETENIRLDRTTVSAGATALMSDPARGRYYVAVSAGEVVGCFLITFEWSDWRNAVIWWLQSVYVSETHRRLGVFKMMYRFIVKEIENQPSIGGLRLYVEKQNRRAQDVYRSLGMNGDHYTVFEWMKP